MRARVQVGYTWGWSPSSENPAKPVPVFGQQPAQRGQEAMRVDQHISGNYVTPRQLYAHPQPQAARQGCPPLPPGPGCGGNSSQATIAATLGG